MIGPAVPPVTSLAGSMMFVNTHLAILGVWILWNTGPLSLPRFDPTFSILAVAAAIEAIFQSTFAEA